MNHATFDSLTRRASLAGASLGLAALALPIAAEAKNKNKKRKKKAKKKCQNQVETCSTLVVATFCGNDPDPECVTFVENCCQPLDTCDFTTFITCLTAPA